MSDSNIETRRDEPQLPTDSKASIFANSFLFSEGSPIVQNKLYRAIHSLYPTWVISDDEQLEIVNHVASLHKKRIEGGVHKSLGSYDDSLNEANYEMRKFQEILHSKPEPLVRVIPLLTESLIEREIIYFSRIGGRHYHNPKADSWDSFFVRHVVVGDTTGSEVYDRIFSEIRIYLTGQFNETPPSSILRTASQLHSLYNDHHDVKVEFSLENLRNAEVRYRERLESRQRMRDA